MPKAPKAGALAGPDPSQSGTGQGALTDQQLQTLAEIWWHLATQQREQNAVEFEKAIRHSLSNDEYNKWVDRLNENYANRDDASQEEHWRKYYAGDSVPGGMEQDKPGSTHEHPGYNWPLPRPGYLDPQTGQRSYMGPGRDGNGPGFYGEFSPDGSSNPPVAPAHPNPEGWGNQWAPPEGQTQPPRGGATTKPASAVAPAVAAVAASLYTRMKLLNQTVNAAPAVHGTPV